MAINDSAEKAKKIQNYYNEPMMIIPLVWQGAGFWIESNMNCIKESYLDIWTDNMKNKQFHQLLV